MPDEGSEDRADCIRLDASRAVRTDEGFLRVPARITRTGIMEYRRARCVVRELRKPDEVFRADSIATLAGVPLTKGHAVPYVTARDTRDHAVGYVGSDVREADGRYLEATLHVWRADAVEDVAAGRLTEISAGYRSKLAPAAGGTWQGQAYDLEQTAIRYNHVALLPPGQARGGSELAIRLDSHDLITLLRERLDALGLPDAELASALGVPDATGVRLLLDGHLGTPGESVLTRAASMIHVPVDELRALAAPPPNQDPPRVSNMKRQIVINGVTFEVEVPDALGGSLDVAVQAERTAAEQVRTDAADAAAERDKLKTERDELKTERDELRTRCDAMGLERVRATAKSVHPEVEGATPRAVHESTLKHLGYGEQLRADASDDAVAGMFDLAVAAAAKDAPSKGRRSTGAAPPSDTRTDAADESSAEAARKRMIERSRNAWRPKEA